MHLAPLTRGLLTRLLVCGAVLCLCPGTAPAQWGDEWLSDAMPSRPRIETAWQPLALPIGEMDLLAAGKRLGLTREQMIALESRLPAYLSQACELRRRANAAIADVGLLEWQNPNRVLPKEDVHKVVSARQSYERELARLDSSLWDDLAPLLSEPQQSLLLGERLRRDRQRILTDGVIIDWISRTQLLVDIGDVVAVMDLPPEQRDAAVALTADFETQATARLRTIFELATNYPMDMAERSRDLGEDFHQAWQALGASRTDAFQKLIELEYECVDRIAGVLSPESAAAFREAHAGVHPSVRSWGDMSYVTALGEAVASLEAIDPALRAEIAQRITDMGERRRQALPELINITRRLGVAERVRIAGNQYYGMTMEEYQRQMPLRERQQTLSREMWEGYNQVQELLKSRLSEDQLKAVRNAEGEARTRSQQSRPEYRRVNEFGEGNVVTMISMGATMDVVMPASAPRCSAGTLHALGLSADQQAGADGVLIDAAERWGQTWQAFLDFARPLLQMWYQPGSEPMDVQAHQADSKKATDMLLALRSLQPEAMESLKVIVGDDRLATWTLAAQQWADAAARPRNVPAPIEIVRTSHYRTLTSQLDRLDPVTMLLQVAPPSEATAAAWQAVADAAPVALERIWKMREVIAESYLNSARYMRWQQQEMQRNRENPQQMDWTVYRDLQQVSSKSCLEAQRLRREHLAELVQLHETIAGLLPADLKQRYVESISRGAYPDAWTGVDKAQRLIDRALAAPDVTDAQRQQIQDAWLGRQGELRDHTHAIEQQIISFVNADDMTREASSRTAPIYAQIEQTAFERDEAALSVLRLLRPILSHAQMATIEETASAK